MVVNAGLGSKIVAKELLVQRLLSDCALVGGIYTMSYDHCLVLTNDLWKQRSGGVSQHCFLLATAMAAGEAPDIEDEEVILLRVVGPAPLPAEAELIQVRAEAMREIITRRGAEEAATPSAILDVLTRNEIQFSGLRAKILGTFYESEVDGQSRLTFGSDLDSYYSASRYKVYKPYGTSLSLIASYPISEIVSGKGQARSESAVLHHGLDIGVVRYSSTERRQRRNAGQPHDTAVPVRVHVEDFIALKTAVFGMTRLGKSNSMKTIATAICQYAAETNQKIGQLLFDPSGEYANVTVQDRTALAKLGPEFVTTFRFGATNDDEGVRPLSTNFFSDETIDVTWAIVRALLSARRDADYVRSFVAADVIGPDEAQTDRSAFNRARRRRAALYATLIKAGFTVPSGFRTQIVANASITQAVNSKIADRRGSEFTTGQGGSLILDQRDLLNFWDGLIDAQADKKINLGDWVDSELSAILAVYRGSTGSGYRLLEPLRVYHSIDHTSDYADEVLSELKDGKVVIIDLSHGSESVLQFCSERIIQHIVRDAARRFAEGREPLNIQLYIEEAHRLFNRDRMNAPAESDPYIRLAKEAAKLKIGLIYATQEVSEVDPVILSNTSNWIVAHLNNHHEVSELSKYYDFKDFAELTVDAEDVGFARLKTRSGRYIIPVQIALFDDARVQSARNAMVTAASQLDETG